jgi:hypothetical protein
MRLLVSYDGDRCGFVNILPNAAFPERYDREFYSDYRLKLPPDLYLSPRPLPLSSNRLEISCSI